MKQQVLFIHGGDTYDTYEEYLADLRSFTVDPYVLKKRWRMTLPADLGDNYEVIRPEMPNKQNAKYAEWKIWFEKYVPFLREQVIFIGHSLGASFLLRYMSEEVLPVRPAGIYFIAAPCFSEDAQEGGDFRFQKSKLKGIANSGPEIVFYHSQDDAVVPFDCFERFTELLPSARTVVFEDRGHFMQESFPELIADIKAHSSR